MATLEYIPDVTKLSDNVIRVLGQNPGKFTLQGTNTYLIGNSNPYILIDTAEGKDEYIPILESALLSEAKPTDPSLPDISDVIISHWHHDHTGGLSAVLALFQKLWTARNPGKPFAAPRIHKFPLSADKLSEEAARWNVLPKILDALPKELYTPSSPSSVLHDLADGQTIQGNGISLRVLHTPGHTLDSISLYIPEDYALYTADTILGQGTSVFEDLGLYLGSLNKMLEFTLGASKPDAVSIVLYPSHGPVVTSGKETISMYIKHRLEREAQVVQLLSSPPSSLTLVSTPGPDQVWSTWDIVKTLYASYPENLWQPAMHGIDLHLKKLKEEGRIKKVGGEGKDATWRLVSRTPTPSL